MPALNQLYKEYVIDRDGAIAHKSAAGPFGFKPAEVAAVLKHLMSN